MNDLFEIERKFLIAMPSDEVLACADRSEITQTYLKNEEPGHSERVRKRVRKGSTVYTHTFKKRISSRKRIEIENEISEEKYKTLLERKDEKRNVIEKVRCCIPYEGHVLEIDIFPFWKDRAFLEIELADEMEAFAFPPFLKVLKEVTDDKRYTNASLALQIPYDEIDELWGGALS